MHELDDHQSEFAFASKPSSFDLQLKSCRIASWSNVLPTNTRRADYDARGLNRLDRFPDRLIPRGAGKSFGDCAYLSDGVTLCTRRLTTISEIDRDNNTVLCGSGVPMGVLHSHLHSQGYSFPVYGGTQWATVGGAVACDIHGKNVAVEGAFGRHVESIVVQTADDREIECSRTNEPELFAATIGGMGLTGLIRAARLRLRPHFNSTVLVRVARVADVPSMSGAFGQPQPDYEFLSWSNCTDPRSHGLYFSATHAPEQQFARWGNVIQLTLPRVRAFNGWSIRLVQSIERLMIGKYPAHMHVFSLNYIGVHERIKSWNRLFGQRGMIEYHFSTSAAHFPATVASLIAECRKRKIPMFFSVVKKYSEQPQEGLLSFVSPGYGMNFQIHNNDENRRFLVYFTDLILERQGRVYLAKDSCILDRQFAAMYERLEEWRAVAKRFDPTNKFQSDQSRRLRIKEW